MEIGLDYMQMRTQAQYYGLRWAGIGLVIIGLLMVLAALGYYGNLYWLRSNVGDFASQQQDAIKLDGELAPVVPENGRIVSTFVLPAGAYHSKMEALGFTPLAANHAAPLGTLPEAERLIVPELGINVKLDPSTLTGSSIVDHASKIDPAGYGGIQANPGERGAIWLFGQPGDQAGNFGGLTNATELLDSGEDVLIYVSSDSRDYLYAATHTDVIPATELRLSSADRATIHLAVPVPPGLFNHFLVMSGELVGVK